MKTWQNIYAQLPAAIRASFLTEPPADLPVVRLSTDTRTIQAGDLFIALPSSTPKLTRETQCIQEALQKGALGVLARPEALRESNANNSPCWGVQHLRTALGHIASAYYDKPSETMQIIGVTGTNGKTTIATLLAKLLESLGHPTGYLTSVAYHLGQGKTIEATHTTPDVLAVHSYLSHMQQAGCHYATMEVSSHGIDQERIAGVQFKGGIFTNITHEHMDYHSSFESYLAVKKRFFDYLPKQAFSLVNVDDKNGRYMLQNTLSSQHTYGLRRACDYKARIVEDDPHGITLDLGGSLVSFRLSGRFNAYNLLAISASAQLLGFDKTESLTALSSLSGVPGRFEWVPNADKKHIVIDYAHTPDALEQVASSLHQWTSQQQSRLIAVLGCGGNRDKEKRPLMGKTICKYADLCFFTSDNPRDEDPYAIILNMQESLTAAEQVRVYSVVNRKQAIAEAISLTGEKDVLLIAGKGCEPYQEIAGKRTHFLDKQVVQDLLNA